MKNKKINGCDVGIVFSIVGIVASIIVIIIDIIKKESVGVGIGLVIFCFLSLFTNIKNKKRDI
jgi:hypothetical protein